jgi:hypothetical protein
MFNVISMRQVFWMLTADPFDASRFARRVNVEVFGIPLKVSSPEDTILAKLRWSTMSGGGEKSFIDALRVFEVQHEAIDREYLDEWVERLGVSELWARLQAEAELM